MIFKNVRIHLPEEIGIEVKEYPFKFDTILYTKEDNNMRIQFDGKAFHVIKNEHLIKSFPLREWEVEYDALGKIQAIDFIKNSTGQTVLDYNEFYEKIRVRK